MALGYRLVQRKVTDLKGGEAQVKTFAIPRYNGRTSLDALCRLIAARSTVSSADVKAVLDSLNFVLDLELQEGRIVEVGELGNFRLSLSSSGANSREEFTPSMLRRAKVIFTPGSSLQSTRKLATYRANEPEVVEVEAGAEDDSDDPIEVA